MHGARLFATFLLVDALALTMCRPSTTSSVVATPDAAVSSTPAPPVAKPEAEPPTSASVMVPAGVESAIASSFVHPPESCAELDEALAAAFRARACRTDAECTNRSVYCGCSQPVSKAVAARIDALQKKWSARRCMDTSRRPCATCTAPREPRCVGGVCSPGPFP